MRKLATILHLFLITQIATSQEVCDKKNEVEDINDISSITKCSAIDNLDDNETNLKPETTVLSARNRQKRRYSFKNRQKSYLKRKRSANSVIHSLKLSDIKENISAINSALEEKIARERIMQHRSLNLWK